MSNIEICLPQPLTLRDHLITHAPVTMKDAMLACGFTDTQATLMTDERRATVFAIMARLRCEYADAMLAARGPAELRIELDDDDYERIRAEIMRGASSLEDHRFKLNKGDD